MAIDLGLKRHLVFFEIDNSSPHDLSRFHRIISQSIATGKIAADDFEEVIGSYEGKMNVAYCLTAPAWVHLKGVLAVYMINQREVYAYDFDAFWLLCSVSALTHKTRRFVGAGQLRRGRLERGGYCAGRTGLDLLPQQR